MKLFKQWIDLNYPNPRDFGEILNISQSDIYDFFNNLKPKIKPKIKKIPRIKTEDKLKKNNIDITFHTDFINLSD
jgi:uncharacterized HAD superfamily protein